MAKAPSLPSPPTLLLPAHKSVLAMSRAQFLRHTRASAGTSAADKVYVGVLVFRVDESTSRPSVLLLRRRLRRRHHRHYRYYNNNNIGISTNADHDCRCRPGEWELPGGKVGDGDFCISAAAARMVAEETGLRVVKVVGKLGETRRVRRVRVWEWGREGDGEEDEDKEEEEKKERKVCVQLNYAVLVDEEYDYDAEYARGVDMNGDSGDGDDGDGVLAARSRDHDGMVWADWGRVAGLPMADDLRRVVYEGLAWAGGYFFGQF